MLPLIAYLIGHGERLAQGMHLGFCASDPGSVPGRASGQASQFSTLWRLAVSLEQGESSSALVLMDIVLNPQPTKQRSWTSISHLRKEIEGDCLDIF